MIEPCKRIALLVVLALLAACTARTEDAPPVPTLDLVETAAAAQEFSTLVTALRAAGLEQTLVEPGPFTLFAPNNDAFATLPPGILAQLLQPMNKARLRRLLAHHVARGQVLSGDVVGQTKTVATLDGGEIEIDGTGIGVSVGEAAVIEPDRLATNGVLHVIDTVLQP